MSLDMSTPAFLCWLALFVAVYAAAVLYYYYPGTVQSFAGRLLGAKRAHAAPGNSTAQLIGPSQTYEAHAACPHCGFGVGANPTTPRAVLFSTTASDAADAAGAGSYNESPEEYAVDVHGDPAAPDQIDGAIGLDALQALLDDVEATEAGQTADQINLGDFLAADDLFCDTTAGSHCVAAVAGRPFAAQAANA